MTDESSPEDEELEYKFVEKLTEDQICSICMKVLCQPHLINCCENQFCQDCLVKWLKKNKTCPHCRSRDHSHMLMKETRRKLEELKVYCPNKKHGCLIILKKKECDNHLSQTNDEGCPFVCLKCPNKCTSLVFRGDMQKHTDKLCPRRLETCEYCSEVDEYQYISEDHVLECTKYPIDCPLKCGATVPRKDLETHRDDCPLEIVPCPYNELGCEVKLQRKDLEQHVTSSMLQHTTELAKSYLSLKKEHTAMKEEFSTMKRSYHAVGDVMKTMSADNLQVRQIRTLMSDTTPVETGDSLYLTLSKTNKDGGQHFIRLDEMIFKLQWEKLDEDQFNISLSLKLLGALTPCDIDILFYEYKDKTDEDESYIKLAKVCCSKDGIGKDEPYKTVGTVEHEYSSDDEIDEMEIRVLRHKSLHCPCACHLKKSSKLRKKKSRKFPSYL